mgnify:CR=1 FL=1
MDARRCISYLTIELKGPIPTELRPLIGDRIYGCDDCLDACPWNRFAKVSREMAFAMRPEIAAMKLRDYLSLDDDKFRRLFSQLAYQTNETARVIAKRLRGVWGTSEPIDDLPALERASGRLGAINCGARPMGDRPRSSSARLQRIAESVIISHARLTAMRL